MCADVDEAMTGMHADIEPYDWGHLGVGDGHRVYWETCGNRDGKPALVVHGGPGSGCTPWQRRLFDPHGYRVVLFDQRGCGRSTPHASLPEVDLAANTTQNLIDDMEQLRMSLDVDRWLVWGGSWGCTLALAYAEAYPERVSEMILWGITTGRRSEFDWLFRGGLAPLFPEQWERFAAFPEAGPEEDIVAAYSRLLHDHDPGLRREAAAEWCMWESATPDCPPTTGLAERYQDPEFALAFARLVTHYVKHDGFLEEGVLLRGAKALADIPAVLINGRFDLQAPLGNAWELKRAWPGADLVIVENAGHAGDDARLTAELLRSSDRFVSHR
jgi:proline iminopeptidase